MIQDGNKSNFFIENGKRKYLCKSSIRLDRFFIDSNTGPKPPKIWWFGFKLIYKFLPPQKLVHLSGYFAFIQTSHSRGVFKTFELRVLTVIHCPKIAGTKGR